MITMALRAWNHRFGALVLAAVLLLALPADAMRIKEVTSPKGIKGWLIQDQRVPLFTMNFAFRGGAALDPVGKEGLADEPGAEPRAVCEALAGELRVLGGWLDLESIVVGRRGDLARRLRRALG